MGQFCLFIFTGTENIKSYIGLTWETSKYREWVSMPTWGGARKKAELELWSRTDPALKAGFKHTNYLP